MREILLPQHLVSGRACLAHTPAGLPPHEWLYYARTWEPNAVLYNWASILAQLLTGQADGKPYKIGGMLFEYENGSGSPVSAPPVERDDDLDYLASLDADPNRDYLRVPLVATTLTNTDPTKYAKPNKVTYFAQSTGSVGVHGKEFSDTVNSRVYSVWLVAYPQFSDASQDLVWARLAISGSNQLVKIAGSQISCAWEQTYG